jgi:hypothetical protein
MMNMQQLVIPAKAGIQSSGNPLKILDSRFHGNDGIMPFSGYYESIKDDEFAKSHLQRWLSKNRQMRGAQISRNEAYSGTPQ